MRVAVVTPAKVIAKRLTAQLAGLERKAAVEMTRRRFYRALREGHSRQEAAAIANGERREAAP